MIETTTNPATNATQDIYRSGSVLISPLTDTRSNSNLILEVNGGPVALSNTGTVASTARGLVAASINPTLSADGCSLISTENSTINGTSRASMIMASGTGHVDGIGSYLLGTSECSIGANGLIPTVLSGMASSLQAGITGSNYSLIAASTYSLISASNQGVILGSTGSTITSSTLSGIINGSGTISGGTHEMIIGSTGGNIDTSNQCSLVSTQTSTITNDSSQSAVIASEACTIGNSNQSVVLASTNASAIGTANLLLIGVDCIAEPSKTIGLQIGGGLVAPTNPGDGIGISATITAKGTPISTGTLYAAAFTTPYSDYGEMFEWEDGNPYRDDRRGLFVAFSEAYPERIRIAMHGDAVLGVVTETSNIIGNSQELAWVGALAKDKFGQPIHVYDRRADLVSFLEQCNYHTSATQPESELEAILRTYPSWSSFNHPNRALPMNLQNSPEYDAQQVYIPRSRRSEWTCVGLLGCLVVLEDHPGSCVPGQYISVSAGKAVPGTTYRVMRRISPDTVMIFFRG